MIACTTTNSGRNDNPVTIFKFSYPFSNFIHYSRRFMSKYHRIMGKGKFGMECHVKIRSTNSTTFDFYSNHSRGYGFVRNFFYFEVSLVFIEYCRFHTKVLSFLFKCGTLFIDEKNVLSPRTCKEDKDVFHK